MFIANIRAVSKLTSIFIVLILLLPSYIITFPFGNSFRRAFSYPFFKVCLICSGITVTIKGKKPGKDAKFYISNHVSYLDIPLLATVADGIFVAKADVSKWPVIGTLAKLSRTLFVSRKAVNTLKERNEIAKRLKSGEKIFLFPEGSSSNGQELLNFKPGLLSSALLPYTKSQMVIQPLSIIYGPNNDQSIRDQYAWYGDMDLAPHVWNLLKSDIKQEVIIKFHPQTWPSSFQDRKTLAQWAHRQIKSGLDAEFNNCPKAA